MVQVKCIRCNGQAEGKTAEEAADRIDHAIGRSKGRLCTGGDNAPYEVIGTQESVKITPKVKTAPKVIVPSKPKTKKHK